MNLKTLFFLLSCPVEQPLPSVPEGKREILALEMVGADGKTEVIATMNFSALSLTPERKSSVMRLVQLVGAGVTMSDQAVTIRELDKAPSLSV